MDNHMKQKTDRKTSDEFAQKIRQQIEADDDPQLADLSADEREDYADRMVASTIASNKFISSVLSEQGAGDRHVILHSEMPLEEWLSLLLTSPRGKNLWNWSFPSDVHREQYLGNIASRDMREIKCLLYHLLAVDDAFSRDGEVFEYVLLKVNRAKLNGERFDLGKLTYEERRILQHYISRGKMKPRDSIAWVVDLIDWSPYEAINALNAYISAHWLRLPDGRIDGLLDALSIIRAICSQTEPLDNVLATLTFRDFEFLVARLYQAMGFDTKITPQTRDGGKDIIATKTVHGLHVTVRVDAKHWTSKVGEPEVRQMFGVIEHEKAVKGVIITSNWFTRDARRFEKQEDRMQLIDRKQLFQLLNEYFGPNWASTIDRLIIRARRNVSMENK
jgi:restriction system protein